MLIVYKGNQKGFTLIETLIYIALLAFIIGAGVSAAYYIIDSSARGKAEVGTIAEAEFLMRKIDWALTGSTINTPISGTSNLLSVDKYGFSPNPIEIDHDSTSNRARIRINGSGFYLTSEWVKVTGLEFISIFPNGVIASSTIDGAHFEVIKYIRQ